MAKILAYREPRLENGNVKSMSGENVESLSGEMLLWNEKGITSA